MIFLFAFLMLVFLAEYMAPHKFSWKPTYDKNDKEPFGSYVFDDILSSSIDDYTVSDKTFYQLVQEDSTISSHAFLLTENYLYFNETDIEYLYKLIHLGNQVMICTDNFPYTLEDTLCFETSYGGSYIPSFEYYIKREERIRDSIFFGTDTLSPECIFKVYPQIHPISIVEGKHKWHYSENDHSTTPGMKASPADTLNPDTTSVNEFEKNEAGLNPEDHFPDSGNNEIIYNNDEYYEITDSSEEMILVIDSAISDELLLIDDSTEYISKSEFFPINCDSSQILVWDNKNQPLVIRVFIGNGEIILVSTPLMFTNYGMLDGSNASYAFRLLSCMKGKPLTRIEAYGSHSSQSGTPLRYVLSEPPLRWTIYSILILLMLFMIFTAKRRQRIIPVVKTPPNRTFGFMELISNLYYQKHDNGEILKMKHMYFCAEVKSLIGIDLQENIPDESDYKRLMEKTGLEQDFLGSLLKNIQMAVYRSEVNDLQLKQYIDGMNDILHALKI